MQQPMWYTASMPVAFRYSVLKPGYARPRAIEACVIVGVLGTLLGVSAFVLERTIDTEPAFLRYSELAGALLILLVWLRVWILWKAEHKQARLHLKQHVLPCVRCGHPLADQRFPRCSECGYQHMRERTIEYWRNLVILPYPSWLHAQQSPVADTHLTRVID